MKAKSLLAIALALAASAGWATDFVWTGASTAVDKTWADAANWTVGGAATDTWPKTADDTATFNTPCVPVRNEEATVGEIILNADVTLRFDKWLTVGKISGNGELILMNKGRLRNISGTSLTCNNNIRITSSDSTDCDNHGAMPYIQANGAEFYIAGKLLGDSHVFFTAGGGNHGVHLDGDNSEFTGTVHIDSNASNHMRFASADAGSTNATWILHGNTGDNGTVTFTDGGTIKFGSFKADAHNRGNYPWRFKALGSFATVEIGHLNAEDDIISVRMGENSSNTGMAKIRKVGTGTLELWHTGHQYGTEIAGGTVLATSVDALNGRTDSETGAYRKESTICFTGGTLKYGRDEWTDASNPVDITTDWSDIITNSTEFIAVDTNGKDVNWATQNLKSNNPNAKGIKKIGDGTLTLTQAWRAGTGGTREFFTSGQSITNYVNGGTLAIGNANKNATPEFNAKMLGTGKLKIVNGINQGNVEDNCGYRLRPNGSFEEFEGTLEWASTGNINNTTDKKAVGFMPVDQGNLNWPKLRFSITGDPESEMFVMRGESKNNDNNQNTVTVGAYDHYHPKAVVRMSNKWNLNINGTKGDSYLNGKYDTGAVTITKTGADSNLTIGPDFSSPENSKIYVNEGTLDLQNPDLSGVEVLVRRGVEVTGKAMFGTGTLKYCDENGNTLATYNGTTITTTTANDKESAAAVYAMISGTTEAGQDESAFAKTFTSASDTTWTVTSTFDTATVRVEPEVAAPAVANGNVEFTIPAENVKKGLYYAVETSSDNSGWTAGEYEKAGESEVSLTAEMPASGVKYYRIKVADSDPTN